MSKYPINAKSENIARNIAEYLWYTFSLNSLVSLQAYREYTQLNVKDVRIDVHHNNNNEVFEFILLVKKIFSFNDI